MINYYNVLEISPNASSEVIRAAYLALIRKYHEDKNPAPDAKEKSQQINEAYDVLKDPIKRAEHDNELRRNTLPTIYAYTASEDFVRRTAFMHRTQFGQRFTPYSVPNMEPTGFARFTSFCSAQTEQARNFNAGFTRNDPTYSPPNFFPGSFTPPHHAFGTQAPNPMPREFSQRSSQFPRQKQPIDEQKILEARFIAALKSINFNQFSDLSKKHPEFELPTLRVSFYRKEINALQYLCARKSSCLDFIKFLIEERNFNVDSDCWHYMNLQSSSYDPNIIMYLINHMDTNFFSINSKEYWANHFKKNEAFLIGIFRKVGWKITLEDMTITTLWELYKNISFLEFPDIFKKDAICEFANEPQLIVSAFAKYFQNSDASDFKEKISFCIDHELLSPEITKKLCLNWLSETNTNSSKIIERIATFISCLNEQDNSSLPKVENLLPVLFDVLKKLSPNTHQPHYAGCHFFADNYFTRSIRRFEDMIEILTKDLESLDYQELLLKNCIEFKNLKILELLVNDIMKQDFYLEILTVAMQYADQWEIGSNYILARLNECETYLQTELFSANLMARSDCNSDGCYPVEMPFIAPSSQ